MTPDLRAILERWLHSDDEVEQRHARHRLGLEYPSFFQQTENAVQAVGSVVSSVIRGEAISVPQEEQDRRLTICHACEFWDVQQGRCSKCGCFGQWKTWLAMQQCPIGKW